jgi:hypothetical protein
MDPKETDTKVNARFIRNWLNLSLGTIGLLIAGKELERVIDVDFPIGCLFVESGKRADCQVSFLEVTSQTFLRFTLSTPYSKRAVWWSDSGGCR